MNVSNGGAALSLSNTTLAVWMPTSWTSAPFAASDSVRSAIVVDHDTAYFGSEDSKLYALDIASGKEKWTPYVAGNKIISSPAVADGVVYVTSLDYILQAINAADGKVKWKFNTNERKLVKTAN